MEFFKLLMVMAAQAAEHGHEAAGHHDVVIPTKTIMYQAINLIILFGFLIYKLRPVVISFFAERQQTYLKTAEESAAVLKKAQEELSVVSQKLSKLESGSVADFKKAEEHALTLKAQLEAEAQALSERIKKEAQEVVKVESAKAVTALKQQLIKDSAEIAQNALSKDIGTADHSRLQGDFVKKFELEA